MKLKQQLIDNVKITLSEKGESYNVQKSDSNYNELFSFSDYDKAYAFYHKLVQIEYEKVQKTVISDHKIRQLEKIKDEANEQIEDFSYSENVEYETYSLKSYIESAADNDPDFFRFLFNNPEIGDYGSNLNKAQIEAYNKLLKEI